MLKKHRHNTQDTTNFELSFIGNDNKQILWLPLVCSNDGSHIIGITSIGDWIIKTDRSFFLLDNSEAFLFAIPFLEMPLEDIKQQTSIKIDIDTLGVDFQHFFPVLDIISAGLKNGQYWALLAMNWLESLPIEDKVLFLSDIEEITTSKWAGQKLRQKSLREMKNIKKFAR